MFAVSFYSENEYKVKNWKKKRWKRDSCFNPTIPLWWNINTMIKEQLKASPLVHRQCFQGLFFLVCFRGLQSVLGIFEVHVCVFMIFVFEVCNLWSGFSRFAFLRHPIIFVTSASIASFWASLKKFNFCTIYITWNEAQGLNPGGILTQSDLTDSHELGDP